MKHPCLAIAAQHLHASNASSPARTLGPRWIGYTPLGKNRHAFFFLPQTWPPTPNTSSSNVATRSALRRTSRRTCDGDCRRRGDVPHGAAWVDVGRRGGSLVGSSRVGGQRCYANWGPRQTESIGDVLGVKGFQTKSRSKSMGAANNS